MTAWLSVIGIGEDGVDGLASAARSLLDGAELVIGSRRVLDALGAIDAETKTWSSPIDKTLDEIVAARGRRVAVLATGDPMHCGIGAVLTRHVEIGEMTVVPSVSAFSLAAARLGWPLAACETVTLHGRAPARIEPHIQPGARLLCLTAGRDTVCDVVERLRARGFAESALAVLEHMGGARERRLDFTASDPVPDDIAAFHTLGIRCVAGPDAQVLPRVPGLPDEAFDHDGQLTKREVRAATLAALGPTPGATLWDVGAGCGSIAIEWLRAERNMHALAFERNDDRLAMIAANALALGVPDLEIVAGAAPGSFGAHDAPDAVFLGGGVGDHALIDAAWVHLRPGGRFVANAVTLEGERALYDRHQAHGGELVRMDVSSVTDVGRLRAMRPRMAVTQWRCTKPLETAS